LSGGGEEADAQKETGREVFRRRKRGGGENPLFPRWRGSGEIGKNYTTLHNILQPKECKEAARVPEVQSLNPLSPPFQFCVAADFAISCDRMVTSLTWCENLKESFGYRKYGRFNRKSWE